MNTRHSIEILSKRKEYMLSTLFQKIYTANGNIINATVNKTKHGNYLASLLFDLPTSTPVYNIVDRVYSVVDKTNMQHSMFLNNKKIKDTYPMSLKINLADTPGIIHNTTKTLMDLHIDIENINSYTTIAPMAGFNLFNMELNANIPNYYLKNEISENIVCSLNENYCDVELFIN